jgi:phosphoenolpyruvate carboxykinase (ATP)
LLHGQALKNEPGTVITSSGAIATTSGEQRWSAQCFLADAEYLTQQLQPAGEKTGRSPKDKRVVRDAATEADVWWASSSKGSPNFEMDER